MEEQTDKPVNLLDGEVVCAVIEYNKTGQMNDIRDKVSLRINGKPFAELSREGQLCINGGFFKALLKRKEQEDKMREVINDIIGSAKQENERRTN